MHVLQAMCGLGRRCRAAQLPARCDCLALENERAHRIRGRADHRISRPAAGSKVHRGSWPESQTSPQLSPSWSITRSTPPRLTCSSDLCCGLVSIARILVVNDGVGMNESGAGCGDDRRGDRDYDESAIGRFGFGLKAASFSQADLLTVLTRRAPGQAAGRRWSLERAKEDFSCEIVAPEFAEGFAQRRVGIAAKLTGDHRSLGRRPRLPTSGLRCRDESVPPEERSPTSQGISASFITACSNADELRIFLDVHDVDEGPGQRIEVQPLDPFGYPRAGVPGWPKRLALETGHASSAPIDLGVPYLARPFDSRTIPVRRRRPGASGPIRLLPRAADPARRLERSRQCRQAAESCALSDRCCWRHRRVSHDQTREERHRARASIQSDHRRRKRFRRNHLPNYLEGVEKLSQGGQPEAPAANGTQTSRLRVRSEGAKDDRARDTDEGLSASLDSLGAARGRPVLPGRPGGINTLAQQALPTRSPVRTRRRAQRPARDEGAFVPVSSRASSLASTWARAIRTTSTSGRPSSCKRRHPRTPDGSFCQTPCSAFPVGSHRVRSSHGVLISGRADYGSTDRR